MARYTGQCSNCGSNDHPNGNIFTVKETALWECTVTYAQADRPGFFFPETKFVKVCNNCDQPHAFYPRQSAKAKAREARFAETLAWLNAQEAE